MFKKILSLLLFLIVVANCDYSPVYLKGENSKLNIDIIKIDGDSEINNIITKEISEIANNNYSKKIRRASSKRFRNRYAYRWTIRSPALYRMEKSPELQKNYQYYILLRR